MVGLWNWKMEEAAPPVGVVGVDVGVIGIVVGRGLVGVVGCDCADIGLMSRGYNGKPCRCRLFTLVFQ